MAKQHLQDYRDKFAASSQELRAEREARLQAEAESTTKKREAQEASGALQAAKVEAAALQESLSVFKAKCLQLQADRDEEAARYAALHEKATALALQSGGLEQLARAAVDREVTRIMLSMCG